MHNVVFSDAEIEFLINVLNNYAADCDYTIRKHELDAKEEAEVKRACDQAETLVLKLIAHDLPA